MDCWAAKQYKEDLCDPNERLGLCSAFLLATSLSVQCQTDAICMCTCELCVTLEAPQNSPGLSPDGKFFFTVIAPVGLLVDKKKNHKAPLWGEKITPCYGHRVTCSILFSKRMGTDLTDLTVNKVVNGLHPCVGVVWYLLMVTYSHSSLAWNCFSWSFLNCNQESLMEGEVRMVLAFQVTMLFLFEEAPEPTLVVKLEDPGCKQFWDSNRVSVLSLA